MTVTHSGTGRERAALAALLGGIFMVSVDVSIVNVAAPAIAVDLAVTAPELQLVISAYSLAYAALLITGARLGQLVGYRRLFVLGLIGFTAASALCGAAWSPIVLIVGRALQGVAAAATTPQVVTLIQLTFDGARRTRALALWAVTISAGFVVGQIVGGALVASDVAGLGWRSVFLVNVPIGLAVVPLARRALAGVGGGEPTDIDVPGVVLLATTVAAVIVPLLFGPAHGWPWWCWVLLVAAAMLAVAGVRYLRARSAGGRRPLIDVELFRHGGFRLGLITIALVMAAYGAFLLVLTVHLQRVIAFDPMRTGGEPTHRYGAASSPA